MPQLGPAEILIIFVVALLVFGPTRLPEVGRQVGRGMRELRKIQDSVRSEIHDVLHADDPRPGNHQPGTTSPAGTGAAGAGAATAPSRYRTSGTPQLPAGTPQLPARTTSDTGTTGAPTPPRAPSRYRAPGV